MKNAILVLDPNEQQAFRQLLDLALRHAGLGAFDLAKHFETKLASALQVAAEPAEPAAAASA
ncbi:MAG: hypothetical protein HY765_02290 [Rhodomicrobium sp.]|nr:hypothetical protein [Rhodomicrobium sp.]